MILFLFIVFDSYHWGFSFPLMIALFVLYKPAPSCTYKNTQPTQVISFNSFVLWSYFLYLTILGLGVKTVSALVLHGL